MDATVASATITYSVKAASTREMDRGFGALYTDALSQAILQRPDGMWSSRWVNECLECSRALEASKARLLHLLLSFA